MKKIENIKSLLFLILNKRHKTYNMSSFKYEISGYLDEDIIHEITCPINHEIMTHPVITPYGHTFDFYSITKWLETHNTCPFSRKPLLKKDLLRDSNLIKKLDFYLFVDKIKRINIFFS